MATEAIRKRDLDHVWHHVMQMTEVAEHGAKIIARGEGALVWDVDGKEYIDSMSGIYTNHLGHCNQEIMDAIYEQGKVLEFYPIFQYYSNTKVSELGAKLAEILPGDLSVSFFCSGGSEAVESAIKIARQYHFERGQAHRWKIIALQGGFHGVTFAALSATGVTSYRYQYGPLVPGFYHVPPPFCYRCPYELAYPACDLLCAKMVEKEILFQGPDTVAAFIGEPVINPLGEVVPPREYYQRIREICNRHGVLMILDEVITGFGRTGTLFGCEYPGVVPDIVTLAKGMASGYQPIGAAVTTPAIASAFAGSGMGLMHGHTFGGHPLACAAALKTIEIIQRDRMVERVERLGRHLFQRLEKLYEHRIVGDVRGKGLLVGIDLVKDKKTKEKYPPAMRTGIHIRERAFYEYGIICRDQRDVLVIAPPFVCTAEQLDRVADGLDAAIGDIEKTL